MPIEESHNSQLTNHRGPKNHSACGLMVPGPQWLPSGELCNFSVGVGSCFYPMTMGISITVCWEIAQFPTVHFSIDFDMAGVWDIKIDTITRTQPNYPVMDKINTRHHYKTGASVLTSSWPVTWPWPPFNSPRITKDSWFVFVINYLFVMHCQQCRSVEEYMI